MEYFLINKYLSGNASEEEVEQIYQWIEVSPENKTTFIQYKKAWALTIKGNSDNRIAWEEIQKIINKRNRRKNLSKVWRYAAIFISIIGITYFFVDNNNTIDNEGNQLIIADDNITLELENGNVKVIHSNGAQKLINISGKVVAEQIGNILNYEKENSTEELAYNILTIPNGKKFQVVLSDGTEVYLNSGSVLKYPVKFIAGINRQVYLLEGEAYFDVTKDAKHPFIVNAADINVRVLGTEFNVSSYPEDSSINTVLVEGSVSIFGKDKTYDKATSLELKPGYKASWNKTKNNISVEEVDTNIYTGWKNGKLIFKNIQFKSIIKKLERHYNVTIINNNTKLNEQYYDATFDIETIEQVLNSFNKSYEIEYTIEKNKIIIN
ncbi:MAG: FecR family protein [Flavobacteriaceae bacterium]|nr:FecR family protein [Flavobacteriaceae bacterium]